LVIEGGYSETAVVKSAQLVSVPDQVSDVDAACLSLNYVSARQMLRMAKLRGPGVILVHGAGGGVGTALVQLARLAGHTVYGTASAGKHAAIAALGAIPIDYRSEDFVETLRAAVPSGVDAVFDGVGGEHLERSLAVLSGAGRLVAFGFSSALEQGIAAVHGTFGRVLKQALKPWGPSARFYGIGMPFVSGPKVIVDDLNALLALVAAGTIKPLVAQSLPFSSVVEAHALLEAGSVTGKIVLEMAS
jgi:NADPH:quinone reductase-like Zn-dependent oxidoreductase